MQINFHIPEYPLNSLIKSIICYEGYTGNSEYEILLPDGSPQLIIPLDENTRYTCNNNDFSKRNTIKDSYITGLFTEPLTYLSEKNASTLSIQFEIYGLSTFLGIPANELTNTTIETNCVLNHKIIELREKLLESSSFNDRITLIEQYFHHYLPTADNVNFIKKTLLTPVFHSFSLKDLSNHIGYSQKHIIAYFQKHIGITPKQYKLLCKINKAIGLLHNHKEISAAQIAYSCGFFDQSHFIKNFKKFTSITPNEYLKTTREYPHVISRSS